MTDIVERLRSDSQRHDITPDGRDYTYTATPSALEIEAADEIERLRAALEAACNYVEWLLRYVPKTGSGDAAGAAVNARDFLEKSRRALEAKDE